MTRGPKRRRSLDAPEALSHLLDRTGDHRLSRVRAPIPPPVWREAVGARIAERATPVSLEGGTLVLRTATSAWASELSMLAPEILPRLVARGFAVSSLRFSVRPMAPPDQGAERRESRRVPPPVALPPDLARDVAAIEDPTLRDVIGRAAAAQLAWRAHVTPPPVSEAPRAARAPRAAERGSAPPGRKS